MINEKLYIILNTELGNGDKLNNGEVQYYCPFCNHHKKKLQVNLEVDNKSFQNWKCWVCKSKGKTISSLLHKVNSSSENLQRIRLILKEEGVAFVTKKTLTEIDNLVSLPSDFIPLSSKNKSIEYKNAIRYLKKRGVTTQDIINYNIGYCENGEYSRRIIIPSYDSNNRLNYFISRYYYEYEGVTSNYKNPAVSKNVIIFENRLDFTEPITLVEGGFDAIATKRNVTPLLGNTIQPILITKILSFRPPIVNVALDIDALSYAVKLIDVIMNAGIKVRLVILDDKDPSKLGYKKTLELINSSPILNYSDWYKLKLKLIQNGTKVKANLKYKWVK